MRPARSVRGPGGRPTQKSTTVEKRDQPGVLPVPRHVEQVARGEQDQVAQDRARKHAAEQEQYRRQEEQELGRVEVHRWPLVVRRQNDFQFAR